MRNCKRCGLPLEEGRPGNARYHLECGYRNGIESSPTWNGENDKDKPSTTEHMWKYIKAYLKEVTPL